MLIVDFWHLSNGDAMVATGCHRVGSGMPAMTVSALLRFFSGGTLVVRIVLSQRTWSRCRTYNQVSKSSFSILDSQVDSPGSSLQFIADLPIGIIIILLQQNHSPDIEYLQHYI